MDYEVLPIKEFEEALLQIDRIKAEKIFENCYIESNNFNALEHLTIVTLENIGSGWENGEFSLSQVYMSGIICEELIEKYMQKTNTDSRKDLKIAIGVLLDHHALGKQIVHLILRVSGYDVFDLGQGLSVNEIVDKTIEKDVEFLLISTLMLPSALQVKKVVEKLRERNSTVKIIAGGAPFRLDSNLWQKVNADADGKNGTDVPGIIEKMAKGGNNNEFNGTSNGNY